MRKSLLVLLLLLITGSLVRGQDASFLWITSRPGGGVDPEQNFGALGGITMGNDGFLYVAGDFFGLWKLDPATGEVVGQVTLPEFKQIIDVTVEPTTGNLYVADWNTSQIHVLSPEGTLLFSFGEPGTEPGQLAPLSPQSITISGDVVYASNVNGTVTSILRFNLDGTFIDSWDPRYANVPFIEAGPDGAIYVGAFNSAMTIFEADGTVRADGFADPVLFAKPYRDFEVAEDGTVYVASFNDGVMVISPTGELVTNYGSPVSSTADLALGAMQRPQGVYLSEDNILYMTDNFDGSAYAISALALGDMTTAAAPASQETAPEADATSEATPAPTKEALPAESSTQSVETAAVAGDEIRQWASSATGTSQYGSDGWSFMQATGEPNTPACGDFSTAWASSFSTGVDTLTLQFDQAVIPNQINIHQTYNPGAITAVELVSAAGESISIPNSADASGNTPCPGVFSLDITGIDAPVSGVVLHLDQTLTTSWNEIDAVELVGQSPNDAQAEASETSASEKRQWANFATGTSQFGSEGWSFMQATGEPNTPDCNDYTSAWASATSTGTDMLALEFAEAVIPTQVNIHQTYNPGSITRVELTNTETGEVIPVPDSADPPGTTPCPGVFSLDISGVESPVNGVILYLDQSIGGSWNEIDAVELVGMTESGAASVTSTDGQRFTVPQEQNTGRTVSVMLPEGWVGEYESGAFQFGNNPSALPTDLSVMPILAEGDHLVLLLFFVSFEMPDGATLEDVYAIMQQSLAQEGTMEAPQPAELGSYPALIGGFEGQGSSGTMYIFQVEDIFGMLLSLGGDPAHAEAIGASVTLE